MNPRTNSDKSYSSDVKLAVVLEYIHNPKHKKALCRKYSLSEDVLEEWHRQFIQRASGIFEEPRQKAESYPVMDAPSSIDHGSTTPGSSSPRWGARINERSYLAHFWPVHASEPPAWLRPLDKDDWSKRGMAIWDNETQAFQHLGGQQALDLLNQLKESPSFENGIPIVYQYQRSKVQEPPPRNRRGKKKELEPAETKPKREYETVTEERMRLSPQASAEFYVFLEKHDERLRQIAEIEKKERDEALSKVYTLIMSWVHDDQEQKLDVAARPLPWTRSGEPHTWVCDAPPNRGTVSVSEAGWFWHACIERPDEFKHWSPPFVELAEAMAWTEQELVSPTAEKESTEAVDATVKTETRPAVDLTPFQIAPAVFEPERITYRVIMEIDASPESFKTMEMSFGKQFRYDQKYPSAAKLAGMLGLSEAQLQV